MIKEALEGAVYFPTREETRANLPKAFRKYGYVRVRAIVDGSSSPLFAIAYYTIPRSPSLVQSAYQPENNSKFFDIIIIIYWTHPEKRHGASTLQSAIGYVRLLGQIGRVLDRRDHALDGEESRQIGRVRGDYDEREEPPDAAHYSRARRLRIHILSPRYINNT